VILTNTTKAIAALRTIIDGLPRVVEAAVDRAGRNGLNQLKTTQQFTNRTWQLNSAMRFDSVEVDDSMIGILDIDPAVPGVRARKPPLQKQRAAMYGKKSDVTKPNTYGIFLQWGTKFMTARPFMTDASNKIASELPLRLTDGIADLFNGS